MSLSEFIRSHAVFSVAEALESCGDSQNTHNQLYRAKRRGAIRQVRRGLYVSNAGRFEGVRHDPYAIAEKAGGNVVFCHLSAYALLVGTQDILNEVVCYYGKEKGASFVFDGMRYRFLRHPPRAIEKTSKMLNGGITVEHTTKEQTLLDSLVKPKLSMGLETILKTTSAIYTLDARKAAQGAVSVGPSCCARLGWLLSLRRDQWDVPDSVFGLLRSSISRGPYTFGGARVGFDSEWRIYLPETRELLERWANE